MFGDYRDQMTEDIKKYIEENIDFTEWVNDRDGLESHLNDELFCENSVTGNASGSYTFSSYRAMEYVTGEQELCREALEEFCVESDTIAEHFLNGDWEYFDVTIRCYLLGSVLSDVLDEYEENGKFDEEEDETETEEE